jgi:metal-sulfur cluster biosynthetic enzyme
MITMAPETTAVWQALGTILDPEFAISIVDLGLIYSVECTAGNVRVVMTLTTPTCPSGSWIREGAEHAVRALEGVTSVQVELVFDPAWTTAMLSADARRQLGWSEGE